MRVSELPELGFQAATPAAALEAHSISPGACKGVRAKGASDGEGRNMGGLQLVHKARTHNKCERIAF